MGMGMGMDTMGGMSTSHYGNLPGPQYVKEQYGMGDHHMLSHSPSSPMHLLHHHPPPNLPVPKQSPPPPPSTSSLSNSGEHFVYFRFVRS